MIEVCATRPAMRYTNLGAPLAATMGGRYWPGQQDFVDGFYQALASLRLETMCSSFMKDTLESRHFQAIVGMGEKVVPLIVHELKKEPSSLFLALHQITGEDPIPDSARGKPREMVEAWLLWAERAAVNAD